MIRVERLHLAAGEFRLRDVSLFVPAGQYGLLMGPTGSGKTTILEAIAGLKPIVSGRIVLGDVDVTALRPAERNIGYVPQDAALFPTMTVRDHLELALRIRKWSAAAIRQRVEELAALVGIEHLLARKPRGLSGGEQQRVALGRALSFRPRILCLDEPLSALDDETRQRMIELLIRVRRETGITALHVTHNQREAEQLAETLLRLSDGQVLSVTHPPAARPTV